MPEEDNKILKYNHGEKSMKVRFTIDEKMNIIILQNHQQLK